MATCSLQTLLGVGVLASMPTSPPPWCPELYTHWTRAWEGLSVHTDLDKDSQRVEVVSFCGDLRVSDRSGHYSL